MKFRFLALAGLAAMLMASCAKTSDIDDLQSQIDALKTGQIASLETQMASISTSVTDLKSTDATLKSYISALESEVSELRKDTEANAGKIASLEKYISELQAKDAELQDKITALQGYVNTQTAGTKDWAEGTFSTLAQYDSLCVVVAGISVRVDTLSAAVEKIQKDATAACEKAVREAISRSETSMKAWVCDLLDDYYTIEETDARLELLADAAAGLDSTLTKEIADRKAELAKSKEEITKAYTDAISTAISTLEGKIDTKIASAIADAKSELESQIKKLKSSISSISSQLATLQNQVNDLFKRIQSIVAIPDYSDGSVEIQENSCIMKFDVLPATDDMKTLLESDKVTYTFKIKETATKADASPSLSATFNSYASGELSLTVSTSNLGDDFFKGTQTLSASLTIQSTGADKTSISSSYFPLYYDVPVYPEAENLPCIKIGDVWWAPVNCGYDATHTYGLLYQWGRKYGQGYSGETPEVVTTSYTTEFASHVDTDDTNKGKFYYSTSLNNWYGGSDPDKLWDTTGGSQNSHTPTKSSWDPCPEGWRVPTYAELNSLFGGNSSPSITAVGGQNGCYFNGTSSASSGVFLPAAGGRNYLDGSAYGRGVGGGYWSSSVNDDSAKYLGFSSGGADVDGSYRAGGYSVRCVQE